MTDKRSLSVAAAACVAGIAAGPVCAQASNYTYVRMSLGVPWALYFVFLAGVLIPFIVMIVLAWRSAAHPKPEPKDTAIDASMDVSGAEAANGAP